MLYIFTSQTYIGLLYNDSRVVAGKRVHKTTWRLSSE